MKIKRFLVSSGLVLALFGVLLLSACGEDAQTPSSASSSPSSLVIPGIGAINVNATPGTTTREATASSGTPNPKTTAPSGGSSTVSPTVTPIDRPLAVTPPRAFKYASLEFKLLSGLISNKDIPKSFSNKPQATRLGLEFSVSNPTKDPVRVSGALFQVKLANDLIVKKPVELQYKARDTMTLMLEFEVPAATTWNGAQLTLDENNKEPVSIALDGPVTENAYPQSLKSTGEGQVTQPNLSYKLTKGLLDLDGPGGRVATGKQFLILTVLVSNKDKVDAYVGPQSFGLMVDGNPIASYQLSPAAEAVRGLGSQEFIATFILPQTFSSVMLIVGEEGKSTATIPLALK